jgi:outer membrane protein
MQSRFLFATAGVLASVLFLSCGCKVDQEKEVAAYRKVLDEHVPAATQPFERGTALTLQKALLLANQHNEQLSIEGENYVQALIAKDRAFSGFLPTIGLVPTYFMQDKTSKTAGVSSTSVQTHRLDVPVNGQINLFNGFRDIANNRRAEYTVGQRRELLLDLQATILLDTAQTYYQIIRSEQSVQVLRNSLKVQEERVRDIEARQRAALARALDVAQTQSLASTTRVSLINAENDVRNGRALLALLTGTAVQDSALVDELTVPPQTADLAHLEQTGLEHREDYLAAQQASLAANQAVKVALGEYYPSVSVNANYFLSRESIPTDVAWNALLTANIPIFAAGTIQQDVRAAWSQLRQAKLNESLTRRTILQQTENAYDNFKASLTRLNELHTQLSAAQEAYRQAESAYNAQLATNLERITAQDQLLSTQLQLTSEEYDLKLFYLELLRSQGTLGFDTTHSTWATTQPASAS